ncbi:basic salivary proline-rich protein 3-like [Symphalangus syndactylus]|uniref:basic salivary proline-rich protein 3-like n=1 Tax=Symphalangus syndactylus TaxID=9590 RepID=UPI003004E52D
MGEARAPASRFAKPASPPPHREVSAAGKGEGAGTPRSRTTITSPESGSQTRRPREGRRPKGPARGCRARRGCGSKVWKPRENFSKRKRGGSTGPVVSPPQPRRPPDFPSAGKRRPCPPGPHARALPGKGPPARRGSHARPGPNSRRRSQRPRPARPPLAGPSLGRLGPRTLSARPERPRPRQESGRAIENTPLYSEPLQKH